MFRCIKFAQDATRMEVGELVDKYGLLGYAFHRLLCWRWVRRDEDGPGFVSTKRYWDAIEEIRELNANDLLPRIEPDIYLAKAALNALANGLAIYEAKRVLGLDRDYTRLYPEDIARELIEEHLKSAATADEIEEAIEILHRYLDFLDDRCATERVFEEELAWAYNVASRFGYQGFWM